MSRPVANPLLPAARPASTTARPRPRELPVTNHTCAIHPPLSSQPRIFWRSFSNSGLDAEPEKELISDPFIDFPSQSRAAARCLVVEPLIDCLDLFFRERRKQVVDRHVRQRYQDRFGVRERVVSRFPVVVPDARGSHSSVRHGLNEQEDVGLIHGAPAKRNRLQDPIDGLLISAEDIAGKRFGERLDLLNKLSKVGVIEDRQKRPENLIFHDFVGPGNRVEDSRVEITGLSVGLPAVNHLPGIDQGRKPFDSGGANDARVIRITLGICAVKFDDGFFAFLYKLSCYRLVNDSVARRSAPLSSPCHCAPNNFLRSIRNVRCLIDDRRVLPSQLKQDWSEMFGRRSHHDLSYTHASREEYEIKGKGQEFRNYFLCTNDGTQSFRLKILGN